MFAKVFSKGILNFEFYLYGVLFGVYEEGFLYCLGVAQKHLGEAFLRCVCMALLSGYEGLLI